MPSASETLGRFVAESRWEDLPDRVKHEAKRSLLNHVGCALGVAQTEPVTIAARTLSAFPGVSTVMGRREKLDILGASFVNAIAGNLLDYDDTHLRTVIPPAAPVAPPDHGRLRVVQGRGAGVEHDLHLRLPHA